jgi:hypothetical protein
MTTTDTVPFARAAVPLPVPTARGPLSAVVVETLTGPRSEAAASAVERAVAERLADGPAEVVDDEDVQLALLCLYELHHRGIAGVDDEWEWDPALLGSRARLEAALERELRARVPVPECPRRDAVGVAERLFALTAEDPAPSLSRWFAKRADEEQARELLVLKSLYQLKEADPHTWAIPRLAGAPKAALVEIQADEYGGGDAPRMHAELFATAMRGLGLDDTYGAYVDREPVEVLASLNLMSFLGLHRRLRGAIVGHLAAFEMTSSIPNRLYGDGFRRLGHDATTTWYFDEHVEADAVHEQIAGRDLAGRLAEQEPALVDDILFGAAACLAVEGWAASAAIERWSQGASALRPAPSLVPAE